MALSGAIKFKSVHDISSDQIGELTLAWSENREPLFDFDPRHVLTKDPHEWPRRANRNDLLLQLRSDRM